MIVVELRENGKADSFRGNSYTEVDTSVHRGGHIIRRRSLPQLFVRISLFPFAQARDFSVLPGLRPW